MNLNVKANEGFVKFSVGEDGRVKVDYGYNIASTLQQYAEGLITEEQAANRMTVVALVAGVATKLRADLDGFVDIGADALDAGFLEDENAMFAGLEGLSDAEIELIFTETEGNA